MTPETVGAILDREERMIVADEPRWVVHATLLWRHRVMLARLTAVSLLISLGIAFCIPKMYKSSTEIMPPDQQGTSTMLLAALTGHSAGGLGALGGLAGQLLGGHTSTALYIDLLQSASVSGHLMDRFNLQQVYHKRYRIDTAKHLAHCTKITEEKKSGIIKIEVEDEDRARARDLAQGYLDELNNLVLRTSTSSAHRERVFVEQRLHTVQADL